MRALIGTALLVLACGTAAPAADDPLEPSKLVGEWDMPGNKAKKVPQTALEFETDGRARIKIAPNADSEFNLVTEFMYEVKVKSIVLTKETRDGNLVRTFRVTKFADDVLEATEEGSGAKYSFKRVKGPPPPKPEDKK
jgi:uncharacterized protein (TIGR03066 family)